MCKLNGHDQHILVTPDDETDIFMVKMKEAFFIGSSGISTYS
jgi:hypothetical protein